MLKKLEGYQIKTIFKFMAKKDGFGLAECSAIQKEKQQETVLAVLKGKGRVYGIYRGKALMACYLFERAKVMDSEIPYPKYDLNKENAWDFITGHEVEEADQSGKDAVSNETEGKGILYDIADELENDEILNDIKKDIEEMVDLVIDKKEDSTDKEVTVYRLTDIYNQSVPADVLEEFEKAILAELKELVVMDEVKAVIWNEKILTQKKVNAGTLGYVNAIPLGMSIGVMFGVVFDNLALGICLGMLWGVVFGTVFASKQGKEQEEK